MPSTANCSNDLAIMHRVVRSGFQRPVPGENPDSVLPLETIKPGNVFHLQLGPCWVCFRNSNHRVEIRLKKTVMKIDYLTFGASLTNKRGSPKL